MLTYADYILEASLTKVQALLRTPLNVAMQPGYISVIPLLGRYAEENICQLAYTLDDQIKAKRVQTIGVRAVPVGKLIPTQYTMLGSDIEDMLRRHTYDSKPIRAAAYKHHYLIIDGHHRAACYAALEREYIKAEIYSLPLTS